MTPAFPERPFCSKRCRLIDLGEWASEGHRIAGEEVDADSLGTNDLEPHEKNSR